MTNLYAGWHLSYDALVDEKHAAKLIDIELLRRTLFDLSDLLEMRVLAGPELHDVVAQGDDDGGGGIAGMVLCAPGHVALHTWPLRGRFSLDVFNVCKFDERSLGEFVTGRLNVKRRASHWITRNWP